LPEKRSRARATRVPGKKRRSTSPTRRRDGVDRQSSAERAYRVLKSLILNNELAADSRLLEQEAAERLDMSRTPVREAMVRLEQDGLVEIKPRHGMRVLPVSSTDMREIYEVLTALEASAAEAVARRGVAPDELASLRAAVADMDAALGRDDLPGWAAADERFHRLLVTLTGNTRLQQMALQLDEQAHRARAVTLRLRPKPVNSTRDHARLVAAIARGDAESARRIHHNHRARAGELLVGLLDRLGLKQL
jgi:DNA-binding GntR family transcriptional regulator